ncbi:MAG: DNRLRE domain-containing protein, partial [Actinomycetota bacterium]
MRQVTSAWTTTGVTWNNQPTATAVNEASTNFDGCSSTHQQFDVTDIVAEWRKESVDNHGVLVTTSETTGSAVAQMTTSTYSYDVSARPYLEVTFAPQDAAYKIEPFAGADEVKLPNPDATWQTGQLPMQVLNRGDLDWTTGGPSSTDAACLSYHVADYGQGPGTSDPATWAGYEGTRHCPTTANGGDVTDVASFVSSATSSTLAPGWWQTTMPVGPHALTAGLYDVYPTVVHENHVWFENVGVPLAGPVSMRWSRPPQVTSPSGPVDGSVDLSIAWDKPYTSGPGLWDPSHYRYTVYTRSSPTDPWVEATSAEVDGTTTTASVPQSTLGSYLELNVCVEARDAANESGGFEFWTHEQCAVVPLDGGGSGPPPTPDPPSDDDEPALGHQPLADDVVGVNVATGNWFQPFPDFALPAVSEQFGLVRNLNSLTTSGGIFGPGFRTSAESYLLVKEVVPGSGACVADPHGAFCTVKVVESDGATMFLDWDDSEQAYLDVGGTPTRAVEAGGEIILEYQNGSKQHFTDFDANGVARTTGWADLAGNRMMVDRDPAKGNVPTVLRDVASGREIHLTYTQISGVWLVTKAHVMNGSEELAWTYSYNSGRLAQACQPNTGCQTYTYNADNRVETVTWPNGASTTITLTYDASGRVASLTNGLSQTTSFTYEASASSGGGSGSATIDVIAVGRVGGETIDLLIDGTVVKTWTIGYDNAEFYNSPNFGTYSYTHNEAIAAADIRVAFTNNSGSGATDKDVRIDAIVVNGTRYESEDPGVLGTGVWVNGANCSAGFWQAEYLHCNGFFEYEVNGGAQPATSRVEVIAVGRGGGGAVEPSGIEPSGPGFHHNIVDQQIDRFTPNSADRDDLDPRGGRLGAAVDFVF